MGFISAYMMVYFLSEGLSMFQISIILAVSSYTTFFTDIPTGAIADIFGRKTSVVISYIFSGLLFILVPFSSNFYYLLILFFIWGVSQTLETGAYEAWVVSHLKHNKKSKLIEEFFAKSSSIGNLAVFIGPLVAALLVTKIGMKPIWTIQGIAILICAVFLLFGKEHFRKQKTRVREYARKTIKQSVTAAKYSAKHPRLARMLIALFFIALFLICGGFLWQPYLMQFNMPLEYFGYLLSLGGLLGIVVPILANKISQKFKSKYNYIALIIIAAMILLIGVLFIRSLLFGAIAILFLYLWNSLFFPVEEPIFQRFIPEKMRATIGSFRSTIFALAGGIVTIIFGFMVDVIGATYTLASAGILLIPPLWIYATMRR
jgi:predicted MFS family arabinose efflux permease